MPQKKNIIIRKQLFLLWYFSWGSIYVIVNVWKLCGEVCLYVELGESVSSLASSTAKQDEIRKAQQMPSTNLSILGSWRLLLWSACNVVLCIRHAPGVQFCFIYRSPGLCELLTVCPKAWGRWRELWDSLQKEEEGDHFPGTHPDSIHGSDFPFALSFPSPTEWDSEPCPRSPCEWREAERYISCKAKHPQRALLYKLQKEETKETISLI